MTKANSKVVDNEYPKMLYKAEGREEIHGGKFDTCIVENAEDEKAAVAAGWHVSTGKAAEASAKAKTGSAKSAPAAATVGTPSGNWGG